MPIIIIWVVSCPAIALILIYKSKDNPNSKIKLYFLTIYQGLRPSVIYWEFINTLRKILILMSLLLPRTSSISMSLLILVSSARLQNALSPYKNPHFSELEFMAIMSGSLTITAALVYLEEESVGWLNAYIFIMVLMINSKFLLEWLYSVLQLYQSKNYALSFVSTIR